MKRPEPQTTDERLDEILFLLRKFQTRDKWRTFWGSIGGLVRLIPILISVYFAWYFYTYGEQIIADAIQASTDSFTNRMTQGSESLQEKINLEQIKQMFQGE